MEELTENAEEPDEGESKQSEQKLGKLKYKVERIQTHANTHTHIINFIFAFCSWNTTLTRTHYRLL